MRAHLVLVKPEPAEDFYVLWDFEIPSWVTFGHKHYILFEQDEYEVTEEDFERADRQSLTKPKSQLFPDEYNGFVPRDRLKRWFDATNNGMTTDASIALMYPFQSYALGVSFEKVLKMGRTYGYTRTFVEELEAFYVGNILPANSQPQIAESETLIEDLSTYIRKHLDQKNWLGWASMVYTFDGFWQPYFRMYQNEYIGRTSIMDANFEELAMVFDGIPWKRAFVLLKAINDAEVPFGFGDMDRVSEYVSIYRELGADTIEPLMHLVALGMSPEALRRTAIEGVDPSLMHALLVA